MVDTKVIHKVQLLAAKIRKDVVMMIGCNGHTGHLGGSFSSAEIVAALYGHKMQFQAGNPQWEERDKFIYSKGHAAIVQYAVMAEVGYFPKEELWSAKKLGSMLQGHPDRYFEMGIAEQNMLSTAAGLAAGGFGASVVAFLGGERKSGIETVLDCVDFDGMLQDADLVITGEGQIDSQSLRGKAVLGIACRAERRQVPVIAIVGSVGDGAQASYDMGVTAIFSINQKAEDFAVSRYRTKENFEATMEAISRFYNACK